jgi:uncharacterized protein YegL
MDTNNMSMFTTPNQFAYSAVDMGQLGATEYTLVNILVDVSGSVGNFKTELDKCLSTIIDACKKHPRSGNLLARVAMFNSAGIVEIHGFSLIKDIDTGKYNVNPMGGTPLWDATLDAVDTTGSYAKTLTDQDYLVNGIFFVMTDGEENESHIATVGKIKSALVNLRQSEALESVKSVLIGVGVNGYTSQYLDSFKNDAGFDEFIHIDDTTAGKLAKLAAWVSQSISSTSQALGTGGASQSVAFVI